MDSLGVGLLDFQAITHAHMYGEYIELISNEYSDYWQFYRNEDLGLYKEGAD